MPSGRRSGGKEGGIAQPGKGGGGAVGLLEVFWSWWWSGASKAWPRSDVVRVGDGGDDPPVRLLLYTLVPCKHLTVLLYGGAVPPLYHTTILLVIISWWSSWASHELWRGLLHTSFSFEIKNSSILIPQTDSRLLFLSGKSRQLMPGGNAMMNHFAPPCGKSWLWPRWRSKES